MQNNKHVDFNFMALLVIRLLQFHPASFSPRQVTYFLIKRITGCECTSILIRQASQVR